MAVGRQAEWVVAESWAFQETFAVVVAAAEIVVAGEEIREEFVVAVAVESALGSQTVAVPVEQQRAVAGTEEEVAYNTGGL